MPLNHYQEAVIKALIRLSNKRIHQYIEDGSTTDFSGLGVDFFFSDVAIKLKTNMQGKAVIATLDDLIDLGLVKSSVNYLGNVVFQLTDIQDRLDKASSKEALRHE